MSILFWWVLFPLAVCFGLGSILGAPYLPIRRQDREELLDLVNLKSGQTIIDLGSGDGTFLIAAAKRGLKAIGYEINPVLCFISYIRCFRYRKLVRVRWQNFWNHQLPQVDAIYIFLIDRYMGKLKQKLEREIKTPTVVVSYVFELPSVTAGRKTRNAYIYNYPLQPEISLQGESLQT